jgi:nicotinamide phosphoribosyltransferase
MFLKDYLSRKITMADVDEAEAMITAHGLPFHREGFEKIVTRHDGHFPRLIEALPEGMIAPTGTPLVQVRNTDPDFFWLPTFIETALLRAVWYPSTVATVSHGARQIISASLERTCDAPDDVLPFRLHDFGARGATSLEQAGIGGVAIWSVSWAPILSAHSSMRAGSITRIWPASRSPPPSTRP